jgi:hypothetical protein
MMMMMMMRVAGGGGRGRDNNRPSVPELFSLTSYFNNSDRLPNEEEI